MEMDEQEETSPLKYNLGFLLRTPHPTPLHYAYA